MNILTACDHIVLSGGLIRFDRIARTLSAKGHRLSFVALGSKLAERRTDLEVLNLHEARKRQWDAVLIPGAGFPPETIDRFQSFRNPQFGRRVQFILNDPTARDAFRAVNAAFAPHLVIFNNDHWAEESYSEFKADRFHILLGAVDVDHFKPTGRALTEIWTVGGLANKNPLPLVTAISALNGVQLKLFGRDAHNLAKKFPDLVSSGRLILVGTLDEHELPLFYRDVDCVVSTELYAGWSNLSAEAMASGVPVICTKHGTTAFARDSHTAIVTAQPDAETLAAAIESLRASPQLCKRLSVNGRAEIEKFNWNIYCTNLLEYLSAELPEPSTRHRKNTEISDFRRNADPLEPT
jgi:glycosyltransferase involved in cell wall biosynthesis